MAILSGNNWLLATCVQLRFELQIMLLNLECCLDGTSNNGLFTQIFYACFDRISTLNKIVAENKCRFRMVANIVEQSWLLQKAKKDFPCNVQGTSA